MVIGNLLWVIWMHLNAFHAVQETVASTIIGKYILFTVNVVQILCLYLGFPFAIPLYSRCCAKIHKSCEGCCRKIALKRVKIEAHKEYELLTVEKE